MAEPDGVPVSDTENSPAIAGDSPTNSVVPSSAETDARTCIQKTQSESGDEASQTKQAKSGEVAAGSKLGPYYLIRKLGQGGMGAV